MLGNSGAKAVEAMLADASRPREGMLATFLGIGTLLFAAIGVVVQLKDALNTVWEVQEQPGHGVWQFMRSYVVSLAAVLGLGFSSTRVAGCDGGFSRRWKICRSLYAGVE